MDRGIIRRETGARTSRSLRRAAAGPWSTWFPQGRERATRFCTDLCWWLCAAQRPISALYTPTAVPCPNRRTSWCIRRRPETPVTGGARLDAASVAAAASDSVVEITTESVQTRSYFNQYVSTGAGSGVIISADGYIVTNDHVISGANSIAVRLHDGTTLDAALVATDAKTDLAVIRVQAQGLIPATLGTSADLVVGQPVVAIGNPLGRLGGTVTDGIISAKDRVISIDGEHMTLLQTNAAVNPGNSGGGLFDAQARLVGVVNSKSSGSDVEGLGFAIPIDTARPVVEQLITQGYVSGRPSLGMELVELTSYRSAIFAGTGRLGVYVNNGGKTGLTNGDYLLSIDGLAIETMTDVKTALSGHSPGDTVTVQYLHSGAVREAAVVLVEDIPAA